MCCTVAHAPGAVKENVALPPHFIYGPVMDILRSAVRAEAARFGIDFDALVKRTVDRTTIWRWRQGAKMHPKTADKLLGEIERLHAASNSRASLDGQSHSTP